MRLEGEFDATALAASVEFPVEVVSAVDAGEMDIWWRSVVTKDDTYIGMLVGQFIQVKKSYDRF